MDTKENPCKSSAKTPSARQFLDILPLDMSEEKKKKLATEIEEDYAENKIVTEDEKRFRGILESVGREGTEELLHYLKINKFFIAPGSVSHHSNWRGGLVNHSLKVYDCAMLLRKEMIQEDPSVACELDEDKIAVTALLHDICKFDEFMLKRDGTPAHKESSIHLAGHGDKSVILILLHGFRLDLEEALAIRWHMGAKHIKDYKEKKECEKAKEDSALVRLIIRADHMAATGK